MKAYILIFPLLFIASVTFAQTNSPSFIVQEREWRDCRGNVLNAAWKCVSRDGATILLQPSSSTSQQPLKVNVRNLSTNDQAFVRAHLSNCRRQHLVWDNGVYITQDEQLKRFEQKVIALEKQRELRARAAAAGSTLGMSEAERQKYVFKKAHDEAMKRKIARIRANPSMYSPAERRLAKIGSDSTSTRESFELPPVLSTTDLPPEPHHKKKNWSFLEQQLGVDLDTDSQRQREYQDQIALRQAYLRQRDEAQHQLQDAERQLWLAEQRRLQAERAARENRVPIFQDGLDSQVEISRQQQMWAEQQKRDAEMRVLQTH